MQIILENKAYKNSIKGSKIPYIPIKPALEGKIKPVKIPVTDFEEINAFDINPGNSKKYIIFLHGFSHNITSNMNLYKSLLKTKFGILAIDYRGYGKNPPSKNISQENIIEDINAAKAYLESKGIKDIGLIGHSFGAYLAAKASSQNKFNFQLLVSPMLSLQFWYENVIKHPKKYKSENKLIKLVPRLRKMYSKVFDIKKYIKNNKTPTCIVHSKTDRYISYKSIKSFLDEIHISKDVVILPKGGHSMDDDKINAIKEILTNLK